MKKRLLSLVKGLITVVGLAVIAWIVARNFRNVMDVLRQCDVVLVGCTFAFFLLINVFSVLRMQVVFRLQLLTVPLVLTWKLYFLGHFFNLFFPSSVGGDIVKGYYLYKYTNEKMRSFLAIVIDRVIGFFSVVLLCCMAVLLLYHEVRNVLVVWVLAGILVLCCGIVVFFSFEQFLLLLQFPFLPKRLLVKIRTIYRVIHSYRHQKRRLVLALVYSLVFQSLAITAHYMLACSLGISMTLGNFFFIIPLVYVFSMLPSIGGLGVREGSYVYLASMYTTTEHAVALSLLGDLLIYSCSLIGLLVYLTHRDATIREVKANSTVFAQEAKQRSLE